MNISDKFAKHILEECATSARVDAMDNRELLWWLLHSPMMENVDEQEGFFRWIRGEVEDRLYPEYDGDKVKLTEWGWETPDGPIIYIKTDAPK